MLDSVLSLQKEKKYIISFTVFTIIFLSIYFLLDHLNGGYTKMIEAYGLYLVIINILLNIIMALGSAWMFNLSSGLVNLTKKEGKGTFMTMLAVVFGILTYGCTSCVIAFFAVIGITFSVAVLPLAGLPYKFISLAILLLGYFWLIREIKHTTCQIQK